MYDEAIRELRKAVDLSAGDTRSLTALAHTYALSGQRAKAYHAIKDLSRHEYVPPYDIGMIYAGLNDKDLAFEWLEKAREERAPWLVLLETEPRFDNLRSDPRFRDLVRRVRAGL